MLAGLPFVRKLFHDQPQEVRGTAETVAPRVLRPTSRSPTLQDDAYHLKYYEGSPGLSWYTEWWYVNFFDRANNVGGICTFAVFNPGDRALGGAASLTAGVFTGAERNDDPAIEYFDLREFSASYEQADVRLGANRLDVLADGRSHVQAISRDGRIGMDLTYARADEPRLMVDNVRNDEQPWSIASWLVSMPTATVNGTLTFEGRPYQLRNAAGYYDHVWGMWRVHAETWSWAAISNPASPLAFVVAYPAAFQMSTAYLRYQDLRLAFVDQDFTITQEESRRWHKLWQYPTRMTFSGVDATRQYKLDLTWAVRQTSALWEYPLIVFEQTADFVGLLSARTAEGWTPVAPIQESGYCEATATWLPDVEAALGARALSRPAQRKVVVLGGGIGGLSAAHELVERGFEVEVFDRHVIPGGKSRSIPVPGSGIGGRADLLGEHGFRFFPGFYEHLPATMQRIPFGRHTCFDNLVPATRMLLAQFGEAGIEAPAGFPTSLGDLKLIFHNLTQSRIGLQPGEDDFFAERLWQVMTSCRSRRLAELERISWWDFVGAEARSEAYQKFLAEGLSRSLVAAKAKEASARTIGQIQVQLMFGLLQPGQSRDRVLNGPTSQVFLNSWVAYLARQGVRYHTESEVTAIDCRDGRIQGVEVAHRRTSGQPHRVEGDWYVSALPVEVMATLITPAMLEADPGLAGMAVLAQNVRWMNGIQFFLRENADLVHGHALHVDSPWAITSISQGQFWPHVRLENYGDGAIRGILSVDISDWSTPGRFVPQPAWEVEHRDDIAREVWEELKLGLNVNGRQVLRDDMRHSYFLDPAIVTVVAGRSRRWINLEPLFINAPETWRLRPPATSAIPNLFLASDYVQTNTDLACMEAANEAARRAVNAILEAADSGASPCRIWSMEMPPIFAPWRLCDQWRFDRGEPWKGELGL